MGAFLLLWQLASSRYPAALLPSPLQTATTLSGTLRDGTLLGHTLASVGRVLAGFALGSTVGVVVGFLLGASAYLRTVLMPYVNLLRFIPAIAFLTPFVIWFGIGELSKILIVALATVFIVLLNTLAGVGDVPVTRLRAAAMLGIGPWRSFRLVVVPSTMPYIATGMRIALGVSFASIIVAELVSANTGLGYLLTYARTIAATDLQFVAIAAVGACGWIGDKLLTGAFRLTARRYLS